MWLKTKCPYFSRRMLKHEEQSYIVSWICFKISQQRKGQRKKQSKCDKILIIAKFQ